jgi:hypothetical protein
VRFATLQELFTFLEMHTPQTGHTEGYSISD